MSTVYYSFQSVSNHLTGSEDNILLGQLRSKNARPAVKLADFGWARIIKKPGLLVSVDQMTGGIIPACNRPPEVWFASGAMFSGKRWVVPLVARRSLFKVFLDLRYAATCHIIISIISYHKS